MSSDWKKKQGERKVRGKKGGAPHCLFIKKGKGRVGPSTGERRDPIPDG